MDPVSIGVGVVGLALQAFGMFGGRQDNSRMIALQEEQLAISRRQEEVRRQQMTMDAMRRRRQMVREGQVARAQALSNATNQGAQGGSGLQGGFGQISGQTNTNIVGVNQNQEFGNQMFDLNAQMGENYRQQARVQGSQAMYQGLSSLGGAILNNSERIGRIGTYLTSGGRPTPIASSTSWAA